MYTAQSEKSAAMGGTSDHLESGVHVVVFPFPAKGHIGPFIQFSKSLATYGIDVTFITTTPHLASAQRELVEDEMFNVTHHHKIHIACLDMLLTCGEVTQDNFGVVLYHTNNLKDEFSELMKGLLAPPDGSSSTTILPSFPSHFPPPLCIISDMFLGWTQDVADEFKIPRCCLCVASTCYLSLLYNFPSLCEQGLILPDPSNGSKPLIIPGFPPIAPCDVPIPKGPARTKAMETLQYHGRSLQKAMRLLVHSAYELEPRVVESLKKILHNDFEGDQVPKILTIGPLLEIFVQGDGQHPREILQVEHQNNECLQWLDKQPSSSVLYICFGTIHTFPIEQMCELALGLEASGVRFLWVVRAQVGQNRISVDKSLPTLLPKGFMERTKNVGFIYSSWAPQLHCLAHTAIGGFMTHCGWNSILESIAMGVPMIMWPLGWAEQQMNAQFCVDVLDVAITIHKKGVGFNEIVGKEEVERVIQILMKDGMQRTKVKELSKIVRRACAPGGSSRNNLNVFVEELRSMTQSS